MNCTDQVVNIAVNLQETTSHLDVLLEIIKKSEWRKAISKATREYNLKIYNLNKLTPLRVKELHSIISNKFYKNARNKDYWNENQLRLFIWMSFVYGGAIGNNPINFEQIVWETIAKCFSDKTGFFCEFQFKCLKKNSMNADKWSPEEEELLKTLIEGLGTDDPEKLKWNDIAKQFYTSSNKTFFRTGKQCREHWNTYLDPNKLRCAWSFNQDVLLIKAVIDFGRKWSKIASLLENKRSEHTVKNRYNSLMSKYVKARHLKDKKDNVEAQQLFQWLNGLDKQEIQSQAKVEAVSNMLEMMQQKTQQDPEQVQQQQFPRIEERQEYIQFIPSASHLIDKVQSPTMLISPLPLAFPSIVFSPVNIYYKNDMDGGFNLFSFENLRQ